VALPLAAEEEWRKDDGTGGAARLGDGAALVTRPQGPLSFIKTTPLTGDGE
jgi:hypothetical protein